MKSVHGAIHEYNHSLPSGFFFSRCFIEGGLYILFPSSVPVLKWALSLAAASAYDDRETSFGYGSTKSTLIMRPGKLQLVQPQLLALQQWALYLDLSKRNLYLNLDLPLRDLHIDPHLLG